MSGEEEKVSNLFMNVRPKWIDDETVTNCHKCNSKFSFFTRKHHCRYCGQVFCGSCSNHQRTIPKLNYKYEVRVCTDCNSLLSRTDNF